jgi:GNAT superfamily N-acetyltransferase
LVNVEVVNPHDKAQVRRFIDLPFRLYGRHPQWVPPVIDDVLLMFNRQKHPFYEHSDAEFYLATQAGKEVGRLAVMENCRYNDYHHTKQANFYLFECEDNAEAAKALFERAFAWARARGLQQCVGPKGFAALDGYGLLTEGFDERQMMTMMNYNFAYYPRLLEQLGFEKEVDFASFYVRADQFQMPPVIHAIADRAVKRGTFKVLRFKDKQELVKKWAKRIGAAYNQAFVANWEYYPLTDREIDLLVDSLMLVVEPHLVKIITHADQVVGFTFAFPDVSAALQRARGRLWPWSLVDLLLDMRRTKWVALNGNGILPEYHGRGGNALLYAEMEKTVRESGYQHAEFVQIAETAVQMRQDIVKLGGKLYKNHRVYRRQL